jgi:hypothetical protein
MRQGDILSEIKRRVDPTRFDFTRAEGRADFDDALRAEIQKIADKSLRQHVHEMLKEWRWSLYHPLHPANQHQPIIASAPQDPAPPKSKR